MLATKPVAQAMLRPESPTNHITCRVYKLWLQWQQ